MDNRDFVTLPNDPPAIVGLQAHELESVARLNKLEARAEANADGESTCRWEQAAEVVALLNDGWSQQKVADNWKRLDGTAYSQTHVSRVKLAWEAFHHLGGNRPRWNDAYHSPEVRGAPEPTKPNQIIVADLDGLDDDALRHLALSPRTYDALTQEQKLEMVNMRMVAQGATPIGPDPSPGTRHRHKEDPLPEWTPENQIGDCPCPEVKMHFAPCNEAPPAPDLFHRGNYS